MSRSSRRAKAKAIDYAQEQQFSDDDVFEDSHVEETIPSATQRRRARQSTSNAELPSGTSGDFGATATTATATAAAASASAAAAASDDFDVPDPKTRYFEKGYDPNLPHIRERFTFMPELEIDGSPKVELIVGRRLMDDGKDKEDNTDSGSGPDDSDEGSGGGHQNKDKDKDKDKDKVEKHHAEYEYLIKYRGVSYLHLEWKTASDLESMNKSAKNLYRRYVKKLKTGQDEDLEDPDVDASYIQPQGIVDEDEHEIIVELDGAELDEWEKQKLKESEEESDEEEEESSEPNGSGPGTASDVVMEDVEKSSGKNAMIK